MSSPPAAARRPSRSAHVLVATSVVVLSAGSPVGEASTTPSSNHLVVQVTESGAGAPGRTYTIVVTGPGSTASVDVAAGGSATVAVPAGTYTVTEVSAPPGASVTPATIAVTDGEVVAVSVHNPYPAGRITVHRPERSPGLARCPVTITSSTGVPPPVVIDIAPGESATTDWLPLGTYTLSWPGPMGPVVVLDHRLHTDGLTQLLTPCHTQQHRPHPTGRITVAVDDSTPGPALHLTITSTDPPDDGQEGPIDRTERATVAVGATWTSPPMAAGTYVISTAEDPAGLRITPNPVVVPATCADADGATRWCTAEDPPVVVTVTASRPVAPGGQPAPPGPVRPPTTDRDAGEAPSPALPATGVTSRGLTVAAALLIAAGAVATILGRRPPGRQRSARDHDRGRLGNRPP